MADKLVHSGICGETLWSNSCTSRNMFGSSSLCSSSTISDLGEAFGWSNSSWFDDIKTPTTDVHIINESLDSTISEWNETLFRQTNGSSHQGSYPIMLQDDFNLNMNNYQQQSVMDFRPKTYVSDQESSNTTTFNKNYGLEEKQMNSDFTSTCEVLPTNYTLNPSPSSCAYTSTFLQDLFRDDATIIEKPLFENCQSSNFASSTAGIDNTFEATNMNGFLLMQQSPLAFSNNTSSWNASIAASHDVKASILPSTQLQMPSPSVGDKSNRSKATSAKPNIEDGAKKENNEPVFKRPRIETPSPLPTFKVRKEKLGDRITALQQLVSPFGKTDTASVLHEAIEYIKFLHDQVNVLSTPYMKNGSPCQPPQGTDEQEQDLKSRGLCLVPLSSTFPLAAEPPTDFWTPTLGGAFRNDKWEAWNGGSHIALACKF